MLTYNTTFVPKKKIKETLEAVKNQLTTRDDISRIAKAYNIPYLLVLDKYKEVNQPKRKRVQTHLNRK